MNIHSYSNPDRLGLNIFKFCADTSIEEMNEIYNKIILVTEDDAKKLKSGCGNASRYYLDKWYNLLRETQWKKYGFEKLHVRLIAHGGHHNNSCWKKDSLT